MNGFEMDYGSFLLGIVSETDAGNESVCENAFDGGRANRHL